MLPSVIKRLELSTPPRNIGKAMHPTTAPGALPKENNSAAGPAQIRCSYFFDRINQKQTDTAIQTCANTGARYNIHISTVTSAA